jgi:CheY-like chemotaxis protein
MFMPGMSGGDTIKALRERAPSVAIIAMSGLASPDGPRAETDLLSIARKLGAAGGLRKPFRPTELLAALDACFGSAAGSAPQRVGSTTPSMRRLTDPPRPP